MPFSADELAPTMRPLAEAWQLPPRAFTDEAVAGWELEHLFLGGWVCLGHAGALDGRAPSSTSAATAGRGCSRSPRAGCGGCGARITRGPADEHTVRRFDRMVCEAYLSDGAPSRDA